MMTTFQKQAGISLIVFTVLIVCTMVLHPTGGNFDYLLKIAGMVIISHSIALLSLPIATVGFWGLTKRLGTDQFLSVTAFVIACFSLLAMLMAATMNGLVLPFFVQRYREAGPAMIESLQPFLKYNATVNTAFDDMYTAAFCLAMLLWGVVMLQTKRFPAWVAWLGIALAILGITLLVTGFAFNSLHGLRLFISGVTVWILAVGIVMINGGN